MAPWDQYKPASCSCLTRLAENCTWKGISGCPERRAEKEKYLLRTTKWMPEHQEKQMNDARSVKTTPESVQTSSKFVSRKIGAEFYLERYWWMHRNKSGQRETRTKKTRLANPAHRSEVQDVVRATITTPIDQQDNW